jgi:SAM-dependent methyltransferase
MANEWFYDWFNSPYYHLLYHQRNDAEAEYFINNLLSKLHIRLHARLLDIACGRGRHAIYLNKQGYDVTGIDLSVENISYARQFENDTLRFFVQDMRELSYNQYFDVAFNLFTSFGYFETDEQHINSLINFHNALKSGGLLVMDYFNCRKILQKLVPQEVKTVEDVDFRIQKTVSGNKIIKTISFDHGNESHTFKEMVSTFTMDDFMRFFQQGGFEIISTFGSYGLEKFDAEYSDRLIFICKRSDA